MNRNNPCPPEQTGERRGSNDVREFGGFAVGHLQKMLPCESAAFWIRNASGIQILPVSRNLYCDSEAPDSLRIKVLLACARGQTEEMWLRPFDAGLFFGFGAACEVNWLPTHLLWVPFLHPTTGERLGGMVLSRDQPWREDDILLSEKVASTLAKSLVRGFPRSQGLLSKFICGKTRPYHAAAADVVENSLPK